MSGTTYVRLVLRALLRKEDDDDNDEEDDSLRWPIIVDSAAREKTVTLLLVGKEKRTSRCNTCGDQGQYRL